MQDVLEKNMTNYIYNVGHLLGPKTQMTSTMINIKCADIYL